MDSQRANFTRSLFRAELYFQVREHGVGLKQETANQEFWIRFPTELLNYVVISANEYNNSLMQPWHHSVLHNTQRQKRKADPVVRRWWWPVQWLAGSPGIQEPWVQFPPLSRTSVMLGKSPNLSVPLFPICRTWILALPHGGFRRIKAIWCSGGMGMGTSDKGNLSWGELTALHRGGVR